MLLLVIQEDLVINLAMSSWCYSLPPSLPSVHRAKNGVMDNPVAHLRSDESGAPFWPPPPKPEVIDSLETSFPPCNRSLLPGSSQWHNFKLLHTYTQHVKVKVKVSLSPCGRHIEKGNWLDRKNKQERKRVITVRILLSMAKVKKDIGP